MHAKVLILSVYVCRAVGVQIDVAYGAGATKTLTLVSLARGWGISLCVSIKLLLHAN